MQDNFIPVPLELQEFSVLKTRTEKHEFQIELKPQHEYAVCPHCSKVSRKIHAIKPRIVFDIPIHERKVKLIIYTRRFICPNCNTVFTEEFESVRPNSRMTKRYEAWIYKKGKIL